MFRDRRPQVLAAAAVLCALCAGAPAGGRMLQPGDFPPGLHEAKPPRPAAPSRAGGRDRAGVFRPQAESPSARAMGAAAPPVLTPIDVRYYGLDLVPEVGSHRLAGTAHLLVGVTAADLTDIVLDAVKLTVEDVRVNGAVRPWAQPDTATLSIQVGSAAPGDTLRQVGDSLWLAIRYSADPPQRGYYAYTRSTYTFTEPEDSRWWFPCVDAPRDKARFEGWFVAPDSVYAASNGVLVDSSPAGAGLTRWHWREDHPIATYLICLTMARYAVLTDDADGLPLLYLVFPEDTAKARADFARVPQMVRFLSDLFEPYPFDKYGMAVVEPFHGVGAMEHQTMVTVNRAWIRGDGALEDGVLHELAHHWFGNSVSPENWRDIWLNEGFASYCEALWADEIRGRAAMHARLQSMGSFFFSEFQRARYPVSDPPPLYLFGSAIYHKGAWILHMLRHEVGDAAFFAILRRHLADHRYGNASIGGFRELVNEEAGRDLSWFFDQWLDGLGYPAFEYASQSRPGGPQDTSPWMLTLYLRQTQETLGASTYSVPLDLAVQTTAGERRFTVHLTGAEDDVFTLGVDAQPTGVTLDPDGWLLKLVVPRSSLVSGAEPARVRIEALYPNPARGSAALSVRVPHLGPPGSTPTGQTLLQSLRVTLFDTRGRKVRELVDGVFGPGIYDFAIDGRDGAGVRLAAGVYLLRVASGTGVQTRRFVYLP